MPHRAASSRADPVGDFDAGPPRVSFEFFPPKTAEMEARLWEVVKRLEPLRPALCLGHLRRRRLDPRAHPRDGAPHPPGDRARTGGASDLRRRDPRRDRRASRATIGRRASAISWRCAAIRPAGAAAATRRIPAAMPMPPIWSRGCKRVADFEISVAAYPETHPEARSAEPRSRQSEAQARCRRQPGDHPVLLRCRSVPALPRPRRGGRDRGADRAGHPAGHQFRPDQAHGARLAAPRSRPGWQRISTGSTTTPTPAGWSPPRSPPSSAAGCMPRACTNSISTR